MRIYNKKNFIRGLTLSLLGLALLGTGILKAFTVKGMILSVLCLFIGIGMILRSVSRSMTREDKLEERDERNRLITLKSRSKSFSLTQAVSFVLMILFFIMAKVSGEQMFIMLGVGLGFGITVSMIAELCTAIYYEYHE